MGAWIEILILPLYSTLIWSHPTWVRGLKFESVAESALVVQSHPTWVRGLKLIFPIYSNCKSYVAPYMGAWIEITGYAPLASKNTQSHPTWVRGLKLNQGQINLVDMVVAPYMGAWIEILVGTSLIDVRRSRTLHGCVD